jgi:hypothetical protein
MNHEEGLFLSNLSQLQALEKSQDRWKILGLSLHLRQLLLDSFPLVDQVNKKYKIKIQFIITDFSIPTVLPNIPLATFETIQDGLDPTTARPGRKSVELNRDSFLNKVVLFNEGKNYSIKDIIKFEAVTMGGVHLGKPKNNDEEKLKKLEQFFGVGGLPPALRQLKAITRVVLKAMEPIRAAIVNLPST